MRKWIHQGMLAVWLGLAAPLVCAADAPKGADHVWDLTDYLKGTPAQIRDKLNGEVNRLADRLNEARMRQKAADAAIAADTQSAMAQLRQSAEYQQATAEQKQAQSDLDAARKGGSAEDRVAASSRFNKLRDHLAKLERDALANSADLAQDRKRSADLGADVRSLKLSLEKAEKWRNELVDAARNGFRLKSPVREGSNGTLPHVIVRQVVDPHHALVEYQALQIEKTAGQAEGMSTATATLHTITVLVPDLDTAAMKAGESLNLDQNYAIERRDRAEEGLIYVARREPADVDALFAALDAPYADGNGGSKNGK